jgi:hypothetical protein
VAGSQYAGQFLMNSHRVATSANVPSFAALADTFAADTDAVAALGQCMSASLEEFDPTQPEEGPTTRQRLQRMDGVLKFFEGSDQTIDFFLELYRCQGNMDQPLSEATEKKLETYTVDFSHFNALNIFVDKFATPIATLMDIFTALQSAAGKDGASDKGSFVLQHGINHLPNEKGFLVYDAANVSYQREGENFQLTLLLTDSKGTHPDLTVPAELNVSFVQRLKLTQLQNALTSLRKPTATQLELVQQTFSVLDAIAFGSDSAELTKLERGAVFMARVRAELAKNKDGQATAVSQALAELLKAH